jgi:hypothetical protein
MYNIGNLAQLFTINNMIGGMKYKSYNSCKSNTMEKTMKDFEKNKLKDRGDNIIKNRNQAIAIGLSTVHSSCKYNPSEKLDLIDKVNKDLNNKDKELNLTNIIETKDAINILLKKGNTKQIYVFKKLLWDKILNNMVKDGKLNKKEWEEIKKIHELK